MWIHSSSTYWHSFLNLILHIAPLIAIFILIILIIIIIISTIIKNEELWCSNIIISTFPNSQFQDWFREKWIGASFANKKYLKVLHNIYPKKSVLLYCIRKDLHNANLNLFSLLIKWKTVLLCTLFYKIMLFVTMTLWWCICGFWSVH